MVGTNGWNATAELATLLAIQVSYQPAAANDSALYLDAEDRRGTTGLKYDHVLTSTLTTEVNGRRPGDAGTSAIIGCVDL